MKGKNTLTLNQATLCEIVQGWINAENGMTDEYVKVSGVRFDSTDSTASFTIEPDDEATP